MKVILAEKPSVARDIATVVGATTKKDGYFEGNGHAVTYAFGHLVTIAEPEEMNPAWARPWKVEQLPMIPTTWKYCVVEKAAGQFKVIKKLFCDPSTTSIICATDAGREGEHIFRLIYQLTGTSKPVERLWISSLTAQAISEGFKKLRPSKEFDNLARAAAARAHADWIVGLNFTRAYTTINSQLCTIGRVQTPTLALLVERQKAIDSFKPTAFFEVLVTFEPGFIARYITAEAEPKTRLPDKTTAQKILDSIAPKPTGLVKEVTTREKKTQAPALYDLLALQKDANKYFGYSAQETLDLTQNLYEEHKLLSYPRTESRHLSTDMVDELPAILSVLLKMAPQPVASALAKEGIVAGQFTGNLLRPRLGKNYVDDTKLTDHHAIIPTHKTPPTGLPEKQRNIYHLVVTRFLSIFLPAEVRDETTAIIEIGEHSFRARGVVIKEPGWTILEPKAKDDQGKEAKQEKDSDDGQKLPPLTKNAQIAKRKAELKEGKTTAPKQYDDASLLTAMKNAGQSIDDEDLASYMKQSGLGTAATRAAIIERLIQSSYIERSKKDLLPTVKGKALIEIVHPNLKDVALTASWEQRLADMQDGKLGQGVFEDGIAALVRQLLPEVVNQKAALPAPVDKNGLGPCPQCKQGTVRQTPKGVGCNRWKEGCSFSIWREQYGKALTDGQIQELIEKRRTKPIKGFKKKDGSGTYDARLVLTSDFKVRLELDAPQSSVSIFGPCPQCKEGSIHQTPKGVGCNRWKEGCSFSIWREQYGKALTDGQVQELIERRRTKLIKGFKKKDGTGTYDARLVLTPDFKVRLEFDHPINADKK